ncbi:MAG TPA: oligosaccharyl transferase, archaeosortase A system-associated [Candidatus Thermoplasmatota archaeon]|nr:oligosaccharyl transferase, archaeosortase A system-associated [Candidatus Thermoplasmatota archaeon]
MVDEPRPWWKRALLWEIPFLAALGAFMLWVRLLPAKAIVLTERAYYIGTDPFYHYREMLGIVRSFPRVPRWDPWTYYPNGTATNQFGTLFDWAAAAYVVVTQGKDASEVYIQHVLGIYPAILGAILIVPFYFVAKRLLGLSGAIVASLTLAVLPGEFLIRSIAGYSDHHVAEALFALLSILGVYVAAERGHEARDAIRARDWKGARKAILFGILGGVALGLNFYAWPPALLFLAILTVWLTIVILVETARGNDPGGLAFGAAISFAVAGLMMIPVIETTDISDFNAYGILQVIAPLLAAAWVYALDFTALAFRRRGWPVWALGGGLAALGAVALVAMTLLAGRFVSSILWGLSWVTGVGVPRTTLTIAEAREAAFFCDHDTANASCLGADFGIVPAVTFLLLIALFVWTVWKRRHSDILLLVWSVVIFRATDTQIRFSYYLALNMALLIGWAAARVAEAVGLERQRRTETKVVSPGAKGKGRKTRTVEAKARASRPIQIGAVAAVLLIVFPGNVFALPERGSYPGWLAAGIRAPDGDLVVWLEGLDWMRVNTPDAGVDLSLIVPRPPQGERYDYPPQTYGVLSWWDYGHWIETTALRPPVANPFQQAAPFASLWFTETDPATAEMALDDWVGDKGPVRYVWIDDEMATGKYGAITVWAHTQNESRPTWGSQPAVTTRPLEVNGKTANVLVPSAAYTDSMMSRLYDRDADGLSHYRLVYEHPSYDALGSVAYDNGQARCLHDVIPSRSCPVSIENAHVDAWRADPSRAVALGQDAHAYDLAVHSRLKLFERVEGARITGTVAPGAKVEATVALVLDHSDGRARQWDHTVSATAGPDGSFEVVWPYPTTEFLTPAEGGTNTLAHTQGQVLVRAGALAKRIDVTERQVLDGETVPVDLAG